MVDYLKVLNEADFSSVEGVRAWIAVLDTLSPKELKEMQKRVADSQAILIKANPSSSQISRINKAHKIMDEMLKGRIRQLSTLSSTTNEKDYMGILFKAELSSPDGLVKWSHVLDGMSQKDLQEMLHRVAFSENERLKGLKGKSGSALSQVVKEHKIMDDTLKARINQIRAKVKSDAYTAARSEAMDISREPLQFVEPEALSEHLELSREPLKFVEPEALVAEVSPEESLMLEKEAAQAMLDYLKELESSAEREMLIKELESSLNADKKTERAQLIKELEDSLETDTESTEQDEGEEDSESDDHSARSSKSPSLETLRKYFPSDEKETVAESEPVAKIITASQPTYDEKAAQTVMKILNNPTASIEELREQLGNPSLAQLRVMRDLIQPRSDKTQKVQQNLAQLIILAEAENKLWPRIQAIAAAAWKTLKTAAETVQHKIMDFISSFSERAEEKKMAETTSVVTEESAHHEATAKTQEEIEAKARETEVRELFGSEDVDVNHSPLFDGWSVADVKKVQQELLGIITDEIRENSVDAQTLTEELARVIGNNPAREEKTWLEEAKETVLGKARYAKVTIGEYARELKESGAQKAEEARNKIDQIKNDALNKIREVEIKEKLTNAKQKVLGVVEDAGTKMGEAVEKFKATMDNLRREKNPAVKRDIEIGLPTGFKHEGGSRMKPER